MNGIGQRSGTAAVDGSSSGDDVDDLAGTEPEESAEVPSTGQIVHESAAVHPPAPLAEGDLPDPVAVEGVGDVVVGTHDLQMRLGIVEVPAKIGLAAGKIRQHLAPGVVELACEPPAEMPPDLELERIVLGERAVSDHVADEGIGIAEEEADGQGGSEPLAPFAVEEEHPVGRQEPADVLPDLTISNPVLNAAGLQESAETESRKDLQGFTGVGVAIGGQIPLGAPEVRHEFRRQQDLIQIDGTGQLDAVVSHVAQLDGGVLQQLMLEADVPLLHIGGPQVLIDGEEGSSGIGQDLVARGPGELEFGYRNRHQAAAADGAANSREDLIQAQARVAPHRVERRREAAVDHVVEAVAAAENGFVRDSPREPEAGSVVVQVVLEERPSIGGAGEIDTRIGIEHCLGATHRQQGQSLGLVRDRVKFPSKPEIQGEFGDDAPGIREVEIDEILFEDTGLRGPVHIPRSSRRGVERLVCRVDNPGHGCQHPRGTVQVTGRNPAGEQAGSQRVRIPRTEIESIGGNNPRIVETVDLGPAHAPPDLDGVISIHPGQVVHRVQVARITTLGHKIPYRIREAPRETEPVPLRKGLVGKKLDTGDLETETPFIGDGRTEPTSEGEGSQPAVGPLACSGKTREDGTDGVARGVGNIKCELVKRAGEGVAGVDLVVSPKHHPFARGGIGTVEPETCGVSSIADGGVVGRRGQADQGLDDGIRGKSGELEQVQCGQLSSVLPDVGEIPGAGRVRQHAPDDGGRRGAGLPLIVEEEEELVLQDGPAHVETVLMVQEPLLGDSGGVVEEVGGVEGVVLMVVEQLSVELVAAGTGHELRL